MAKKKRLKRTWHAKQRVPQQATPQQPIKKWEIVLAELQIGTASVGIRFNDSYTVHFFLLHQTPHDAANVVAQITRGEMTLQDIANYEWKAVEMPKDYMNNIDKEKH